MALDLPVHVPEGAVYFPVATTAGRMMAAYMLTASGENLWGGIIGKRAVILAVWAQLIPA